MKKVKKYLLLSQISLNGLLILCCLIVPSVVIHNGGVSNFGNHRSTVAIYTLSFLLSVLFECLAAGLLLKRKPKLTKAASLLFLLAFLEFAVLISTFPRHISYTYSDIHDDIAIGLFVYYLLLSIWFIAKMANRLTISLFILEVIGSTIGLLSITKVVHFLFVGQLTGGIGFGALLIICFPKVILNTKS